MSISADKGGRIVSAPTKAEAAPDGAAGMGGRMASAPARAEAAPDDAAGMGGRAMPDPARADAAPMDAAGMGGRIVSAPTQTGDPMGEAAALPQRRRNRLQHYDYSRNGAYFVTICAKGHQCIFGHIPAPVGADIIRPPDSKTILSGIGAIVNDAIQAIPTKYQGVDVDHYVIMPNHVHLIVVIDNAAGGRMISAPTQAGAEPVDADGMGGRMIFVPTRAETTSDGAADTGGRMISAPTQAEATPTLPKIIGYMKRAASRHVGRPIWQKSFHDRIIRNEAEYQRLWEYIENNPLKWELDKYYV